MLVAERDGEVLGTVTLWPPGAPESEAWIPGAADLRQFATHPKVHGQGLSRPLMDAIEQVARERGYPAICLHVRKGVRGVAAMYMARGYRRVPEETSRCPRSSSRATRSAPLRTRRLSGARRGGARRRRALLLPGAEPREQQRREHRREDERLALVGLHPPEEVDAASSAASVGEPVQRASSARSRAAAPRSFVEVTASGTSSSERSEADE